MRVMAFFKPCLLIFTIWLLSNELVLAQYRPYPQPWQDGYGCYGSYFQNMEKEMPNKRKIVRPPNVTSSIPDVVDPDPPNDRTIIKASSVDDDKKYSDQKYKRISNNDIEDFFKYMPAGIFVRPDVRPKPKENVNYYKEFKEMRY